MKQTSNEKYPNIKIWYSAKIDFLKLKNRLEVVKNNKLEFIMLNKFKNIKLIMPQNVGISMIFWTLVGYLMIILCERIQKCTHDNNNIARKTVHTIVSWPIPTIMNRDQSRYTPSQWETSLHCNDVPHWLVAFLDWSLMEMVRMIAYHNKSMQYIFFQIS